MDRESIISTHKIYNCKGRRYSCLSVGCRHHNIFLLSLINSGHQVIAEFLSENMFNVVILRVDILNMLQIDRYSIQTATHSKHYVRVDRKVTLGVCHRVHTFLSHD